MKLTVVISAYNEEKKIEDCLMSVKNVADEIIVVNSGSTDGTVDISKKYTTKVFNCENNPMLNVNKNFGFSKASNPWILNLDADERLTPELTQEISSLDPDSTVAGYFIPRKNIIFGKWIKHTGWYPDYQLRLFRKNKGQFEEKHVHELLKIDGNTDHLKNPITHLNYESITQFLDKMIRTYTVSEAKSILKNGYTLDYSDIYKMPVKEFTSRYFARQGYRDGFHGLVISILMAFYHFIVFLRLWEENGFSEKDESYKLFDEGNKFIKKQTSYWNANEKISVEQNIIKKNLLKIVRKANS